MMVLRQNRISGILSGLYFYCFDLFLFLYFFFYLFYWFFGAGTPRHFQSQNVFFSTPMVLNMEEINVCLKYGSSSIFFFFFE
jgi:hypothetical protein